MQLILLSLDGVKGSMYALSIISDPDTFDPAATGETIGASYQLEYGEDRIEMHVGAVREGQRVILLDDLIATGGTLAAGIKLMQQVCPHSILHASSLACTHFDKYEHLQLNTHLHCFKYLAILLSSSRLTECTA